MAPFSRLHRDQLASSAVICAHSTFAFGCAAQLDQTLANRVERHERATAVFAFTDLNQRPPLVINNVEFLRQNHV